MDNEKLIHKMKEDMEMRGFSEYDFGDGVKNHQKSIEKIKKVIYNK